MNTRNVLLVVDGLALIGLVVFSVIAALEPHSRGYIIGQIFCAGLILGSVLLLRQSTARS